MLHIIIRVNRSQKGLKLLHVCRTQGRWVNRVFGLVAQLGRQYRKPLTRQRAADQIKVGGIGQEQRVAFFLARLKVLCTRFNRCDLCISTSCTSLGFNHAHMVKVPRDRAGCAQLPLAKQHAYF